MRVSFRHLEGVLKAHSNLRIAQKDRFTDHDFKIIVAYAALGIADMAFKKLDPACYWRIGLTRPCRAGGTGLFGPRDHSADQNTLRKAPAPFCWFGASGTRKRSSGVLFSGDPGAAPAWLAAAPGERGPGLAPLAGMDEKILKDAVPEIIQLDLKQADRDLAMVEGSLSKEALQLLLLDQMHLDQPSGFTSALEKDGYSTLYPWPGSSVSPGNLLGPQPDGRPRAARSSLVS